MTNLFSTTLTDRNDIELFEGDYIKFQYVDTMGRLSDELSDEIFVIEFDHGAFIGRSLKKNHLTRILRDYLERREGEYIPNYGSVYEFVSDKLPVELIRGVNKPNGKLDQVVKCLMNMDICKQNFYIISIDNGISFYYIYYVNNKTRGSK